MPTAVFIAPPVLLAIYYVVLIATNPRAPKPGPIVVRYDPPGDLTPAASRYIWKGQVDQRTVACVFAGLATKGRIALEKNHAGYKVIKTSPPHSTPALNRDEQDLMDWLFSNFLTEAHFNPQQDVNGCIMSLRGSLDRRLNGKYQSARSGWAVLGMLGSLAATMLLASRVGENTSLVLKFAGTFFFVCFMAGVVIGALLLTAITDLARGLGDFGRLVGAIAISGIAVAAAVGLWLKLVPLVPLAMPLMIVVLVAMNLGVVPLLRSVTPAGIEATREIEGFREYLVKVEQDRINRVVKANTTPPADEAYLSYAIALELKEAWGDALANACYVGA